MPKPPWLSPSALSVFKDCPRCFWIDKNLKKPRPRGIFPSLPGGMDEKLKVHFDLARGTNDVPIELAGKLPGSLFPDQGKLDLWRNWRTGLEVRTSKWTCGGALDDLWVEEDGSHSPLDFKTKGSAPDGPGYAQRYYQHQMDDYALKLERNEMKISGKAHLIFYSPDIVEDMGAEDEKVQSILMMFAVTILTIPADPARAVQLLDNAAACLAGPMPAASPTCEYCTFVTNRQALHS